MSRRSHNYAAFGKNKKMRTHRGQLVRGDMQGRSSYISKSLVACLALLSGAAVGGLAAGYNARAGLSAQPSSAQPSSAVAARVAKMPPAETVNLRFPADWVQAAEEAVPRKVALASADSRMVLFSPRPADPVTATAFAPPQAAPEAAPAVEPVPIPRPAPLAAAAKAGAAKLVHHSNAVLNDSQIASIKKRLNLTPEQERYWPAVEAELRKMEYSKRPGAGGSRTASVDMSKVNVEGLKSAGYPLVMSFNDDQRRELRSLAHLLGLESAMAGL
jgi:hypothetical protein